MNARWLLGAMLFVASASAYADIYGYVDPDGVVHLATEPLDPRYVLFLRGNAGSNADSNAPIRIVTDKDAGKDSLQTADPALMRTRLFQRLVGNANTVRYEPAIVAAAKRHGLDPQLVKAVVAVESGFEPRAVSDKGAIGLMQVLPATGERYGVRADRKQGIDAKLADPLLNLEIGTRYLSDLRKMFIGRPDLALAAYNAGENAVIRFRHSIPPFPETQAYVKLVQQFHAFYTPPSSQRTSDIDRIHVVIPARRNLPDPNVAWRVPASNDDAVGTASVVVPTAAATDTVVP